MRSASSYNPPRHVLPVALAALLLAGAGLGRQEAHAQTILTRKVIGGGGGTTASSGHIIRGTLSQTAVGRMTHNGTDRHDAGFWYWAYKPDVETIVSIPTLQAEPGTRLTVPVEVVVGDTRFPFTPRPFHARLSFNHTLLHPAGSTPACTYDGNDCEIEIDGTLTSDHQMVAQLEFIAALGDSEATPIRIEEFTWQQTGEERITTTRRHGEFQLLGVCRVGNEIRLIRSGDFASRIRIWPNPAQEETTLEFVSAENGPATIRLVDMLGNEVARLYEGEIDAERLYQLKLDLAGISSGSYVVVYSTTSKTMTAPILITQ